MAQAYDAIIATIVVASDATSVTKAMVKSTEWREGTSGSWLTTDCTLNASTTYQFRTPLSGMDAGSTAILPNIKASVTVAWDTTATPISTVGDYFMTCYAYGCSSLTSLSVPDTSGLTSVGNGFMSSYANGCSSLTSLSVPDTSGFTSVGNGFMTSYAYGCSSLTSLSAPNTSGLTSVGDDFMSSYALGCSSLTSLSVPDTSGLTSVGMFFMYSYARDCTSLTSLSVPDTSGLTSVGMFFMYCYALGCTSLTSLSVPDTSGLTSVGTYFMSSYANGCSSLTSLILPDSTGWFGSHNINWSVPSGRLGLLYGYAPDSTSQTAWRGLTDSGETLYTNYIQATDHVLITTKYSKENSASLKTNDTNLATSFTQQEYTDVATDNDTYVDLIGTHEYFQFLFKELNDNSTDDFRITWKGKSTVAPSSHTVYLQIYNRTTSTWTNLTSNSTASANTKFTLTYDVTTGMSDYYDANHVISARVYQDVI